MFHGTVGKLLIAAAVGAALVIAAPTSSRAQQAVAIDGDDIGGVVAYAMAKLGPEDGPRVRARRPPHLARLVRLPGNVDGCGQEAVSRISASIRFNDGTSTSISVPTDQEGNSARISFYAMAPMVARKRASA